MHLRLKSLAASISMGIRPHTELGVFASAVDALVAQAVVRLQASVAREAVRALADIAGAVVQTRTTLL